jgi:AAA+ ATPase superfamily predicted ATPase
LCSIFQEEIQKTIDQPILGGAERFGQILEIIMLFATTTPLTLVIDEFQDFDKINPAIFGEIQSVWDRYHKKSKLNLVVCGSVNRLMTKIFFDDSQPLYGRNTAKLHLEPFPVKIIKQVLEECAGHFDNRDLLALWTLTGGVARYVELLMDSKAFTLTDMIKYVCSPSSSYIDEGRVILSDEFGKEYGTYFSILSAIAAGKTSFAEIRNIIGAEIGGHLTKLESSYSYISKTQPMYEGGTNRNCLYGIDDCFFRFWFRFVYKYLHLVEQKQMAQLQQLIERDFDVFAGRALERYFRVKFLEEGRYTRIGGWWDRKGENEIDLVCENELDGVLDFYEVKLSFDRYDEARLREKTNAFLRKHPEKCGMKIGLAGLSIKDM